MAEGLDKRVFRILFFSLFCIGIGNSILFSILPGIARKTGMPEAAVGAIATLSAVIWVFASSFWGRRSDVLGRRRVIQIGLIGFFLSTAGFGIAVALALNHLLGGVVGTFCALILSRALYGLLGSGVNPASQAMVADHTPPDDRVRQIGALTAAFALGTAFGPAIAGAMVHRFGFVSPFILTSALALLAVAMVTRFLPDLRAEPSLLNAENAPPKSMWRMVVDPRISAFMVFGVLLSLGQAVIFQVFGFYVIDRLHVTPEAGIALAAGPITAGSLALIIARVVLIPRLQMRASELMFWGTCCGVLGAVMMAFGHDLGVFTLAQMATGVGLGVAMPGYTAGASAKVGAHEQGSVAGLAVSMSGVGFTIGPILGLVIYRAIGITAPYWFTAAVLIIAAMVALTILRHDRSSEAATILATSPPSSAQ